ncbi:TIGR02391 family protein [Nitrosomonas sp.]|uniref:TIGR02391 family protein n=1 Tax=Nitrosomonas sp. TaxID=42353 RepID=UPI0026178C31|nr:TIGR02391 family protein [Nitrosomonas sp.]MCW5601632.1 TIGR02391 family protein [Nitrosomonas sp.]
MPVKSFDLATIESLSQVLGDTSEGLTGTQISKFLSECNIYDPGLNSTKWKRLYDSLKMKQEADRCANNIVVFIQHIMRPSRHLDKQEWYEDTRAKLNRVLSFEGLELEETGVIKTVSQTRTISEADARAAKLKQSLLSRKVHPDVLRFCRAELLVDNYFHAVFEATKSIAEKIRIKTGLTLDGTALVDEAFSFNNKIPHLALSTLQTASEQSEQKGFANLLKGVFGTFRNATAHAPKVTWVIEEQDALDILSTISLIHRRLDGAIEAQKMYRAQP